MAKMWYLVNDIEDFVNSARRLVFYCFGDKDQPVKPTDTIESLLEKMSEEEIEEMNSALPYNESLVIVKEHAKKKLDKTDNIEKYYITDKILYTIIEALNSRMVSNILNHLTNKGILESGYDAELGDFIFWVKEDNEETQKPETD